MADKKRITDYYGKTWVWVEESETPGGTYYFATTFDGIEYCFTTFQECEDLCEWLMTGGASDEFEN